MQEVNDLVPVREWPILPVRGRLPARLAALLPLPESSLVRSDALWPSDLVTALGKLGVRCARAA